MIIWLASYPKSGNTWLRSIISSLIYSDNGKFEFDLLEKIPQFPVKKNFNDLTTKFNDHLRIIIRIRSIWCSNY